MRKVVILSIILTVFVAGCAQEAPTAEVIANETFEPECEPGWECDFWSDCVRTDSEKGIQNRTCIDNKCGTGKKLESRACGMPGMAFEELSEMALQTSDLSSNNWTTIKTGIRLNVSQTEKDLGFKEGYNVSFFSEEIYVKQFISVYPLVNSVINMTFSFETAKENYQVGRFYENTDKRILSISELPDPIIGELSIAYNITVYDFEGSRENIYTICFTKWDVAEVVIIGGTESDYDLLKDLAKIAEERVS